MFGYRKLSEMKGVTGTYKEQHDGIPGVTCTVRESMVATALAELFGGPSPVGRIDRILRSDELAR